MNKKTRLFQILILLGLCTLVVLPLTKCKGFGSPQYDLTIELEDGVTGTPPPGTETLDELTAKPYEYKSIDGVSPVIVFVNGSRWEPTGTFNLYSDMEVLVKLLDVRGTWTIKLKTTTISEEDREFNIVLSGNSLNEGTFTDDRGYKGTWDIVNDVITIIYEDWEDYQLGGTVSTMRGNWVGEEKQGTWSATPQI